MAAEAPAPAQPRRTHAPAISTNFSVVEQFRSDERYAWVMHEKHLAQAERHVIQGEALVAQQRELVGWLERLVSGGYCATESRRLLRLFEEVLGLYIADRDRLRLKSKEGAAHKLPGRSCPRCGKALAFQARVSTWAKHPAYRIFECETCGAVDWVAV